MILKPTPDKVRVAINGFGRIGRAFLKLAWERSEIEIVAINDLGSIESLSYLLKYDTVYRKWNHNISTTKNTIQIDGKEVLYVSEKDSTKFSHQNFNNFIRYFWEQILRAVDSLHQQRIVHCDLKRKDLSE